MSFEQLPIFGDGRATYQKPIADVTETARVLITVKASPQPSMEYGDTVCVAGIRMRESGPEWIRLYPVPFRSMREFEQFSKYELIDVKVRPSWKDPRSESFKPDRSSIQKVRSLPPWRARHPYVQPLADQWTMCEINSAQRNHQPAPSLAAVRPSEVGRLEVYPHPGWNEKQQSALRRTLEQPDLFGENEKTSALEQPRFEAKYHYRCATTDCKGHRQGLLDWEFEALSRNLRHLGEREAMKAIQDKFHNELTDPSRGPLFFVGNQAKHQRTYSVLGVYRTKAPR